MAKNTHVNGVKCEDIEKGIRNKQKVWENPSPEMDETPTPGTSNQHDHLRESVIELVETSDHPQPKSFDRHCIVTTGM